MELTIVSLLILLVIAGLALVSADRQVRAGRMKAADDAEEIATLRGLKSGSLKVVGGFVCPACGAKHKWLDGGKRES